MPQLSAITKQSHADKFWTRQLSYSFAAKDSLALLAAAELSKAVHAFPMVFIKQQDRFFLAAVLSLTPGTNLFVAQNGKWLGGYVPAAFRGYPFSLAKAQGKDNLILCVDEDSGLVHEDKTAGEPFFDDTGEVTQQVKDVLNFLNQMEQNKTATNVAVAALADAGVITQWPLKIRQGDQEKPVTGLYRVDEAKLNSLDDGQFTKLRKAGSLPVAYAQLFSMGNISIFEKLAQIREKTQPKKDNMPDDMPNMLAGDDMISFD